MEKNQPLLHLNCDKGNLFKNNNKKNKTLKKTNIAHNYFECGESNVFFFLDNFLFLMNF